MVKFIETEQQELKQKVLEMFTLVSDQIDKAGLSLLTMDKGMAAQVIVFEHKVNSFELKICKAIEDYIALYNPVAIDLRFVLAMLQISSDLERIGDYARGIARFVNKSAQEEINTELIVDTQMDKMIQQVLIMLKTAQTALEEENAVLANSIFEKDYIVNEIQDRATDIIAAAIIKDSSAELAKQMLRIQDIFRKMERTGDHIKNIAEEIIFYIEAKVIRHKGKQSYEL
ncbi:MAG: phosphate signaling complex protein PhoU [Bacteroidales bacterium]|jgi:phosphate transport system protein|nr:phosphate signaling complex protein PhoU [Bacteroidales bacterium]